MFRSKLVLTGTIAAVSFGGGAALAATHGASHPVQAPSRRAHGLPSNVHYPCHNRGEARVTTPNV